MFSSDRLSYYLFESDCIDQPQTCKKYIIIFGELLQRPHELVIGTLYPLTLKTFTRVIDELIHPIIILLKARVFRYRL